MPVKAKVPCKYPPFAAAGLVLCEADYISDLYGWQSLWVMPLKKETTARCYNCADGTNCLLREEGIADCFHGMAQPAAQ